MCSPLPTPAWPARSPAPASPTSPGGPQTADSTRRRRPRPAPTTHRSPPPTRRWRRTSAQPCRISPVRAGRPYRSKLEETTRFRSRLAAVADAGEQGAAPQHLSPDDEPGGGGLRQRTGGAVDVVLVVVEVDGETDGAVADRCRHSVGLQPRAGVMQALGSKGHGDDGATPAWSRVVWGQAVLGETHPQTVGEDAVALVDHGGAGLVDQLQTDRVAHRSEPGDGRVEAGRGFRQHHAG